MIKDLFKKNFSFLMDDPSFLLLKENCDDWSLEIIFNYKEARFRIESYRHRLQLYVSSIYHPEEEVALFNLIEFVNNVVEGNAKKIVAKNYHHVEQSYEVQLKQIAFVVKENISRIIIFCSKEMFLENKNLLSEYMLKTYPQFF